MPEEGDQKRMPRAQIQPAVLQWARKRLEWGPKQLAEKAALHTEQILRWETGESSPTFRQAQNLARATRIPFGYLFLPTPPIETPAIPDLRTVSDDNSRPLSVDYEDVVNSVLEKQDWYRSFLLEAGNPPLRFVGKFTLRDEPEEVASDMRETLQINSGLRRSSRSWEQFLRRLIAHAESAGILVMRSGIVGNNTHRPLSVQEFRGFAVCDEHAPVVFINGKDAKAAQIFTFAHELAHIWLAASGVSNADLATDPSDDDVPIERFCNRVAAEVLVPRNVFLGKWDEELTAKENADQLVRYFRVSSIVVLRRALEFRLIARETFFEEYERATQQQTRQQTGGDPYASFWTRNSQTFTRTVVSEALAGRVLYREASLLLGVRVSTLHGLEDRMSGR